MHRAVRAGLASWLLALSPTLAAEFTPTVTQDLVAPQGFQVEQLCLVPKTFGSWINMTFDPEGRIIVSDGTKPLYRVSVSPIGQADQPTRIERLEVGVGGAHGLLYAFDSLYVVVNGPYPKSGLYRLRDKGKGEFADPELLFAIPGANEHGPHGIVVGPDGKWLYMIAGNATGVPVGITRNRVPTVAGEFPFAKETTQGFVLRISPDGKQRELFCSGLRNSFDLAMNPRGDLFTFDSDNEGFMGLPWYRPTNVFHLVSGADFGWRQGPSTLPPWVPDCVPPVVEVGPGSPTGMVFGAGAKFPAKYRQALFAADWSYGRIYAIHLRPENGTYAGSPEVFLSGRPLPTTDLAVGPDGALYLITGGRDLQSSLYRVSWQGTDTAAADDIARHKTHDADLSSFHGKRTPESIDAAWPSLSSPARMTRYAARVALEHQRADTWSERVYTETETWPLLESSIALARQGGANVRRPLLTSLTKLKWESLTTDQRLALLRAYRLIFERFGTPPREQADAVLAQLDGHYPNPSGPISRELAPLLFQLNADALLDRTIDVLGQTPTSMRQIHYLRLLQQLDSKDWSDQQRGRLRDALDLTSIREVAARPYGEVQEMIKSLLGGIGVAVEAPAEPAAREIVREWTVEDLLPSLTAEVLASRDTQRGQTLFRQAQCSICHRLGATGGVLGPNLTGLSGRYKPRDVLEAIVEPSKVVADPYRTTVFVMNDGRQVTGQIVDMKRAGTLRVRTDPLRPFARVDLRTDDIEETHTSPVSLMPRGLINHLRKDEVLDLIAYLLAPARTED